MDKNADGAVAHLLRLRAGGIAVPAEVLLAEPLLASLAIDDLCWEIAQADWASRAPRRWQWRRLARWHAESAVLRKQRERIRRFERNCGLPVG